MRLSLWSTILTVAVLSNLNRVQGQITSAVVEAGGATVIAVYGTDAVGAATATQVVQTVVPAQATPVVTSATITPVVQVPTSSLPPILYTYVSVDENGVTYYITDTFTPTYRPTTWPITQKQGTVLAYSDYFKLYPPSNSATRSFKSEGIIWGAAVTLFGMAVGAHLIAAAL